jgi:predicted GIY-YIG superfamily endonuclease
LGRLTAAWTTKQGVGEAMTAGVYMIKSVKDGRVYIGESSNIERRWQYHLWHLAHGTHHNRHLQAAFDGGNVDDLHFCVLVDGVSDREERLRMECQWTEARRAWSGEFGYNIDLRSQAAREWIKAREAAKLAMHKAEVRRRLDEDAKRFEAVLVDSVRSFLVIGELSYEDRERLIELLEEFDEYGFTLPEAERTAAEAIRDTKRTDRVRISASGIEHRILTNPSGGSNG